MILFVLDKVSSVPPLVWVRPKCITLYNGLLRLGNTDDLLLPDLVTRLEQAEQKIQELSDRVISLESELNQLQAEEVNTPESSSTFCSAHPNAFVTGHTDDQASTDSNSANGAEEHVVKANGGPKADHPQTNGTVPQSHPQPPPEPPSVDNFKFTSTPNPVFLSRGKLHHKAKGNKSADVSPTKNPSSESVVDAEDFQKSKKQRVVPDELILQKKLLRKIIMPTGQSTKKGAANQSVEEDDGSLNALMKNALKRKFANVDLNSFNDSHASEETTITEFSI